ncbi:beta-lactamase-like protein [Suillus clintonianus]|uniref:beta-lactamase-like protein n=1 Tax=Suillus clintonianus TaxID=1904413 RepID=UPI001B862EFD|nr:beta-lactamase-like protein [Suillus clintonianus]KAG2144504.1 beta-lactamase-like protein [Suillus clintonianus]
MDVSALEAGHLNIRLDLIAAGDQPNEPIVCPSLAFFLRHSKSDKRVVFDLGIHKNIKEFAPAATEQFLPDVKQTVAESLESGGVPPSSVDLVVLSHLHWDHVGDPSPFTTAEFVLGEGSKKALSLEPGFSLNPAFFSSIRVPEDRLRFITASDLNVAIGPYPRAMDFFGDGSMYIVDAPGHVDGHINILARTSADGAWILLGADSAHHPDLITGNMQVAYRVDTDTGAVTCIHDYKEVAEENIRRIKLLLEFPRVQALVAHDVVWYEENKGKEVFLPHKIPPLVQ